MYQQVLVVRSQRTKRGRLQQFGIWGMHTSHRITVGLHSQSDWSDTQNTQSNSNISLEMSAAALIHTAQNQW